MMSVNKKDFENCSSLLDIINDAISVIDEHGKVIFANNASCQMDGLVKEEVIGKNVEEVYSYTDFDTQLSPSLLALKTGKAQLNINTVWYSSGGVKATGIINSYPMVDHQGKVVGSFSVTQNITLMRQLLASLGSAKTRETRLNKQLLKNSTSYIFENILHESDAMRNAIKLARKYAEGRSSVMIYGETGTGKEMFAQSIHNYSPFMKGQFVAINCAAIPETLMESMLFGTVKGAFTGASNAVGLFEKAENGSVFLDEINSMPINLQAKILRVLQEKETQRIGDTKTYKINCRILSATNKNPLEAVKTGELRADLYYRLATGLVEVPALRNRGFDMNLLSYHFINQINAEMYTNILTISPELEAVFRKYSWPGNVRELFNVIESMMNMTTDEETVLDIHHMPEFIKKQINYRQQGADPIGSILLKDAQEPRGDHGYLGLHQKMAVYEKIYISNVLEETRGNISKSARWLSISRQSLCEKLKKHNIDINIYRS